MAITKVWIEPGCVLCGSSARTCPAVFEVTSQSAPSAKVKPDVDFTHYEAQIKQAAEFCPVEVIKYEET